MFFGEIVQSGTREQRGRARREGEVPLEHYPVNQAGTARVHSEITGENYPSLQVEGVVGEDRAVGGSEG